MDKHSVEQICKKIVGMLKQDIDRANLNKITENPNIKKLKTTQAYYGKITLFGFIKLCKSVGWDIYIDEKIGLQIKRTKDIELVLEKKPKEVLLEIDKLIKEFSRPIAPSDLKCYLGFYPRGILVALLNLDILTREPKGFWDITPLGYRILDKLKKES